MRIDGPSGPKGVLRPGKTGKKNTAKAAGRGSDRVRVADAASLREKARVMLAEIEEARMEQVEAIRDALEKGTYSYDCRKVARRIVANALAEHPW